MTATAEEQLQDSAEQQRCEEAPTETLWKISQVPGYATCLKKVYPQHSWSATSLLILSSYTNVNLFHPTVSTAASIHRKILQS